jgi:hypothetical protein
VHSKHSTDRYKEIEILDTPDRCASSVTAVEGGDGNWGGGKASRLTSEQRITEVADFLEQIWVTPLLRSFVICSYELFKSSINPTANPNPVYSSIKYTWQEHNPAYRHRVWYEIEVHVTLPLTASQYILVLGIPVGPMTRFYFLLLFCWKIALLFALRRPLWREVGSVIYSVICQWPESRRTHNHTLLSHLRLLGSLCVASYDSKGLRWKYSYPPPHGVLALWRYWVKLMLWPMVNPSWCQASLWGPWPDFPFSFLLPESWFTLRLGAPSLTRGRVCNL